MQANTKNLNKTWALLQTTGGKDEPDIVFITTQHGTQNVRKHNRTTHKIWNTPMGFPGWFQYCYYLHNDEEIRPTIKYYAVLFIIIDIVSRPKWRVDISRSSIKQQSILYVVFDLIPNYFGQPKRMNPIAFIQWILE